MKANENWAEIVDTLHPYLDGSREKERYLKDIGNCLRFLGWRKTNGTMVSCPPEDRSSGKPNIVLLKRGEDAGLQAFPVMTESPGEMVYAMGLYIGNNIRLYYNAPGEKGTPACVLTAEIRVDDANGPLLCDLLSFKGFNLKSMENFCLRRYNLIRTGGSFLRQSVPVFTSSLDNFKLQVTTKDYPILGSPLFTVQISDMFSTFIPYSNSY